MDLSENSCMRQWKPTCEWNIWQLVIGREARALATTWTRPIIELLFLWNCIASDARRKSIGKRQTNKMTHRITEWMCLETKRCVCLALNSYISLPLPFSVVVVVLISRKFMIIMCVTYCRRQYYSLHRVWLPSSPPHMVSAQYFFFIFFFARINSYHIILSFAVTFDFNIVDCTRTLWTFAWGESQ